MELENNTIEDEDLETFEVFDTRDMMTVVAYSIMGAVGIFLNTSVLVAAGKQSTRADVKNRTNIHYLVFHLALADAIISYITIPMEAFWRYFSAWHAGNLLCKGFMMFRTGGYILSSLLLVVLSIDRYIRISSPFSSLNHEKQRIRARVMVAVAWILTIVFATPQAIIFRVLKHPVKDFYQCTTNGFFDTLVGLTPDQWADLYHTFFNSVVFFIPLIIIITSYCKILIILIRRNSDMGNISGQFATMKALKMSLIHVLAFVFSWTPYTVMATWDTIDKESARKVPGAVQDILYLTAVLNSCINPLIFGAYYYSETTDTSRQSIRLKITSSRPSTIFRTQESSTSAV